MAGLISCPPMASRSRQVLVALGAACALLAESSQGVLQAQFTPPSQMRNLAGEELNAAGLKRQRDLANVFYGRFEQLREEDPGRARFSWLYYHLLNILGAQHSDFLLPPVTTLEITIVSTRNGFTNRSIQTYTLEQRVAESFKDNDHYRSGLFEDFHVDISTILQRHRPGSVAMIQLYENFFRFATNRRPVQDTPDEWAALLRARGVRP
jgi:hypothetical protein